MGMWSLVNGVERCWAIGCMRGVVEVLWGGEHVEVLWCEGVSRV